MSTLLSLSLLIVFLALGFIAARLKLLAYFSGAEQVFSVALYLLLFSMGLRLGQSHEALAHLSIVGTLAISGTLFACAGTVILQVLFIPLYRKLDRTGRYSASPLNTIHPVSGSTRKMVDRHRLSLLFYSLKKPLVLLILVVLGTFVGFFLPEISIIKDGTIATWLLYFLLFIIGMQMAGTGSGLANLIFQPAVFLVPVVTLIGTLLGSLGLLLFFKGITVGRALALGAGFGWYSLSGILITDLGDPTLGAASFLANLFRETLAFLTIPLLRMTGHFASGVGIAGATSMDVTLPVIEDTWGSEVLPLSVTHGVVLSLLVPFLVPLFMSF